MYSLIIWTVIAGAGSGSFTHDWRELTTFGRPGTNADTSLSLCQKAINRLGLKSAEARCIQIQE